MSNYFTPLKEEALHRLKSRPHDVLINDSTNTGADASMANERLEEAFESMSSLIFSADEKELRDVQIILQVLVDIVTNGVFRSIWIVFLRPLRNTSTMISKSLVDCKSISRVLGTQCYEMRPKESLQSLIWNIRSLNWSCVCRRRNNDKIYSGNCLLARSTRSPGSRAKYRPE